MKMKLGPLQEDSEHYIKKHKQEYGSQHIIISSPPGTQNQSILIKTLEDQGYQLKQVTTGSLIFKKPKEGERK